MQSITRFLSVNIFFLVILGVAYAQGQNKTLATTANNTRSLTNTDDSPHNIRLLGTAADFQKLHTNVQALSAKTLNSLKLGEEFCIDLQLPSTNERWLAQVSDISTVKVVLDQVFQGKMIAEGMPNLHTWKFKAAKTGDCEIVFVLPIAGTKETETVVYKVQIK